MSSTLSKSLILCAFAVPALLALALPASADIIFTTPSNNCTSSTTPACTQSVGFGGGTTLGTTVVGDTNPPKPLYSVSVTSLQGLTLDASGSNVSTQSGAGFTSILITPDPHFAWTAIDFFLDSTLDNIPLGSSGLTLTAYTGPNQTGAQSMALDFPWEGNAGDAQNYLVYAINNELIYSLRIDYTDPTGGGNTIADIHNIDVGTARVIPEPSSLIAMSSALLALGALMVRRSQRA